MKQNLAKTIYKGYIYFFILKPGLGQMAVKDLRSRNLTRSIYWRVSTKRTITKK